MTEYIVPGTQILNGFCLICRIASEKRFPVKLKCEDGKVSSSAYPSFGIEFVEGDATRGSAEFVSLLSNSGIFVGNGIIGIRTPPSTRLHPTPGLPYQT